VNPSERHTLTEGDRVRHVTADLKGTVTRGALKGYVKVRWDHPGLAVAALGGMADLQRDEMLVRDEV
jgi:hypothetical protein